MTNDKALAVVPRTLDEVNSLSELLSKSTLLPDALKGKTADIAVSILAGQELGLSPMAAIRGVFVVQGKPVLSADTMVALVRSSGACEYFSCIEDTDQRVTYEAKRHSEQPQRASWSIEDTKRAGLNSKDNWRLYPRAMMKARAKAALARDLFPDVLAGCYTEDEVRGEVRETQAPTAVTAQHDVTDAEVISDTPAPPELAELAAAKTKAEVKAIAPRLANIPEQWKAQAREQYTARLAEVPA